MKKPLESMEHTPSGDDHMTDAWFSLILYAYDQAPFRLEFKKETGINIVDVVKSGGLNAMIDKSTGYQEAALAKWCDWVTVNLWGCDGKT